jgi:uncharacterized protein (DUF2249 family)
VIRAEDRVAAVLARDERLLEVLVGASPAFERLRNAAMRRTLAKLVTIEQAARIAGVDVQALVERLNAAIRQDGPIVAPALPLSAAGAARDVPPLPAALLATPEERRVDVDVREDLRAGREPFQRIFDAARALPSGSVLRVRATFEPAPLYAVLAKHGLSHAVERLADDDWRVWFHRAGDAHAALAADASAAESEAPQAGGDAGVVVLDVRDLEPPEPMVQTLEALAVLPRGATLVQLNVRVPKFLLPKLEERGFVYEIREQSPQLVRLFIRHKSA